MKIKTLLDKFTEIVTRWPDAEVVIVDGELVVANIDKMTMIDAKMVVPVVKLDLRERVK